jgi:hypothetical protein
VNIGWRRRRRVVGGTALAVAAVTVLAACSVSRVGQAPASASAPLPTHSATATPTPSATPTATAAPTSNFVAEPLKPGEAPPQFIVTSFDGAGSLLEWQHFLDVSKQADAGMTFFLSGPYLVPADKRMLYHPPGHPVGSADISFSNAADIRQRMEFVRQAYAMGDEIGTHFNGHFCGQTGRAEWTTADWTSELDQFFTFLHDWRTNADALDAAPLPFGDSEIVGERTPCLEGLRSAFLPALAARGFKYDTSGDGDLRWPHKFSNGMWDIPMQELRMAGTNTSVLSMDYNFFLAQSGGREMGGPLGDGWERQTLQTYQNAYKAVFNGNRAPLILGDHFDRFNDGIYLNALTSFLQDTCHNPQTRCVSFAQLVAWLNVQTPETIAQLQARPVQQMSR